jgi:DHA1 family tetracycline resistance protein-like MFS transporter
MKRGPLAIVLVYVVVELPGMSLILPLLPFYAQQFATSPLLIGLLGTANAIAQMIGAPLIGRLSDRYGRRPLILLGTLATAAGFVMLGFSRTLWMVFASRILDGLLGGNVALAQAYITDVTDEKGRAKGLGIIGAAFGIGFIIGPAVGGLLARWGVAVPAFAVAALKLSPAPPITAAALVAALRRPVVGPLLHIRLFYALAFGVFQASFALWASRRLGLTAQTTAQVLACVGFLSVLVQGLAIGPLTRRFSERILIVAGIAVLAPSLFAWGFVPNLWLLLVVTAPTAFSAGVLNVALTSALTKAISREDVGGTLGLATALQSLAGIAAPLIGGLLLQGVGAWSLGVFGAVILAWLASFAPRRVRPAPAPAPAVVAAAPVTGG